MLGDFVKKFLKRPAVLGIRLAATLSLLTAALPTRADQTFDVDIAVSHFDEAMFSPDPIHRQTAKVIKWQELPNATLIGDRAEDFFVPIKNRIDFLSSKTGFNVEVEMLKPNRRTPISWAIFISDDIQEIAQSETFAFMVPGSSFREKTEGAKKIADTLREHRFRCFNKHYVDENDHVLFDFTFIDAKSARSEIIHCVEMAYFQLSGLTWPPRNPNITAFRRDSAHRELTEYDLISVAGLYSPQLKPGMSREQALQVFREFVISRRSGN